jgi:transcriptional regulator with XRE-family HTH domain
MIREKFAARLKELREAAGLTQKELAEKAGLKYGAVRDLEQALNGPTWETVLALAGVFGVGCEAFNQETTAAPSEPKRGRPPKAAAVEEGEAEPKRPRGRPRKTEG